MDGGLNMGYDELLDFIEVTLNEYFRGEGYASPELVEIIEAIENYKKEN